MSVQLHVGAACEPGLLAGSSRGRAWPESASVDDLVGARRGSDELAIIGDADLPLLVDLVVAAREAGFCRTGLRTGARRLASGRAVEQLRAAGLTDLLLPLHGATAACHDYHVASPGDYAATLAALAAARSAGVAVAVATAVSRSSFRELGALARLLLERGAAGWLLELVSGLEPLDPRFVPWVPRLSLGLPYALHALDRALECGISCWLAGAPLCRLGPLGRRALVGASRALAPCCEPCAVRRRCGGIDAGYLGRYGPGEIGPAIEEADAVASEPPERASWLLRRPVLFEDG